MWFDGDFKTGCNQQFWVIWWWSFEPSYGNIWVYYWVCHIMPELTADNQYDYRSKSMFMAIPYCFGIEHSYFLIFFRTLIFRELQVCRVSTCTYIPIYGVKWHKTGNGFQSILSHTNCQTVHVQSLLWVEKLGSMDFSLQTSAWNWDLINKTYWCLVGNRWDWGLLGLLLIVIVGHSLIPKHK
jgi:hypothetical protein